MNFIDFLSNSATEFLKTANELDQDITCPACLGRKTWFLKGGRGVTCNVCNGKGRVKWKRYNNDFREMAERNGFNQKINQ